MNTMLSPGRINGLALRNRIIRSGCFEGMCPDGAPSDALVEHHRRVAAGGAAMTTVSYCAVSPDGRSYGTEMWMRPEILPGLRRLTDAVHQEGAAASLQLGHCGYFSSPAVIGSRPISASRVFNLYRLAWSRAMTECDMVRVANDFGRAAAMAREAGFDAVEVHAGHGYLISQFLSPFTNRRCDEHGGVIENRLRFARKVVDSVRRAVPSDFPVLVKMNLEDGFLGGLRPDDAPAIAQAFVEAGADALVPSCGFTSKTPFYMLRGTVPAREMIANPRPLYEKIGLTLFANLFVKTFPFSRTFLLEQARGLALRVGVPVVLIGGVCGLDDLTRAETAGFSFVQMGRALIADPDLVKRWNRGEDTDLECDHCNRCVAAMDAGGVRCVTREDMTGR